MKELTRMNLKQSKSYYQIIINREKCIAAAKKFIAEKKNMVIDKTNATKEDR